MRSGFLYIIIVLNLIFLLSACGQSGRLYLPDPVKPTPTDTETPS